MKKIHNILITILITTNLAAQDINFFCEAPQNATAGTPFNIRYTLKAPEKGKNFKFNNQKGLNLINQAKSQYTSHSTIITNGKMKTQHTITMIWEIIIVANKNGNYNIKPATVTVNGKTYKSNPVNINIGKSTNNQTNTKNNINTNKDFFALNITNKNSAYIGEPIYYYNKIFSAYNFNLSKYDPPTLNNFWIKDISDNNVRAISEVINNKKYLTAILEKKVIFPQKTGTLTIKPFMTQFQLVDGWGFPAGTKDIYSNTKKITVKPLPKNKPTTFHGAVGKNFKMTTKTDNKKINIDQTITITLNITGTGNLGLFDLPEIKFPTTFEKLEPEKENNLTTTQQGITGYQTIKYTYIARVPGKYTINPVKLSYFDPTTHKYKTIKSDTIKITVAGKQNTTTTKTNYPAEKSKPTQLADDIRFIKIKTKLKQQNNFIIENNKITIIYIIPIIIFISLIILMRKKIKQNTNKTLAKYKKADKISKKQLKKAQQYLNNNKIDKFYEEILTTIWTYIGNKMNINKAELTRENIQEKLQNKKINPQLSEKLLQIINKCETIRYAPATHKTTPHKILEQTKNIIKEIEKNINQIQ